MTRSARRCRQQSALFNGVVRMCGKLAAKKYLPLPVGRKMTGLLLPFKCSPESYDIMKSQPGLRPAPYLASRGMKWIQMISDETLSVDDLKLYIRESHKLASKNLTKKRQQGTGPAIRRHLNQTYDAAA